MLLPVYNAQEFINQSVQSILEQTYANFEFIIVDDGSTDDSWDILTKYAKKDARIILLKNKTNQGPVRAIKKAIRKIKGQLIARMDADDIALPDRLKKQIDYLLAHPDTVAVGGQCLLINEKEEIVGEKKFPCAFEKIKRLIFTFIPVQQPTLMIARSRLPKNFVYYEEKTPVAEEVELLLKLFKHGKVENIKNTVLLYRIHKNNTSLKNVRTTFYLTLKTRIKAVAQYGYKPRLSDILINIVQIIAVTCLPQKVALWLYHHIRNHRFIRTKRPTYAYA